MLLVGLAGVAVAARRWTDVVVVRGSSMTPTLLPGDLLLVERRTFTRRAPRTAEVVLARDPRDPSRELIKRVVAVHGCGVELRGDGSASTDSRAFGTLPPDAIAWRVVVRYWPPSRVGRIPSAPPAPPSSERSAELGGEAACSRFGDLVVGFAERDR